MLAETIIDQMQKSIRYVTPTAYAAAQGLTATAYQQMQTDFMPVPLLTVHSPVPEIMAGVWSILRESLLAGQVKRNHKEAIAATVSKTNECPFCVDAHTLMLHANDDHGVADAILRGDYDSIRDRQSRALVQWALDNRTANSTTPTPFSHEEAPEIVGTAVTFHYINRMVNVFLGDSLLPIPSALKGVTGRLLGAVGKQFVRRVEAGTSLALITSAPLPDDLAWAAANPIVAKAFAGMAAIIEQHGSDALPQSVRELVGEHVCAWSGEVMPMSRQWVEDAIAVLPADERAAGRLALLIALASYQVDANVITAFRAQQPSDAELIAATAWASFTAARRAGMWLGVAKTSKQGQ
jgi:AhpD family alkylhydroperoxidase